MDADGNAHFNTDFRNGQELAAALERHPDIDEEQAAALLDAYEAVFRHRQFTGRSGSMFKYEGLGSIYWHMVSKLLLATAEVIRTVSGDSADAELARPLLDHFDEIQDGLGVHKTPVAYGAFTTDPYSHTPGFIGVQQPGMTGQVKEDVITRFCELGVSVREGQLEFSPSMLKREEFLSAAGILGHQAGDEGVHEELEAGCLGFSVCAVPVIYRLAGEYGIEIFDDEGGSEEVSGNRLDLALSQSIFRREGRVQKIVVDIPAGQLR